jgi:LysR family transcriptional regulator, regulator for metE and metH
MNLEIRHLRLVAAIAETGSMTRAANCLHLTQSALSHQLRTAEEELGAPLFVRNNRKMTLTPAGERLLQSARTVMAELECAQKEIQKRGNTGAGVIRLSTECYTVYHWLPSRLRLFQQKFPLVEFQLMVEATDNPYQALLEGKLDVAISCRQIRNRKVRYTPLFEDEMVVIVPTEHRLASRKFLEPEDFAGETVFIYPPKEESALLNEVLMPAGVWPRLIHEVTLTEAIVEMVAGGLGVASIARWAVLPQIAAGTVVARRLTASGMHRTWCAAQLRNQRAPEHLQEFIRLLAEHPISPKTSRKEAKAQRIAAA